MEEGTKAGAFELLWGYDCRENHSGVFISIDNGTGFLCCNYSLNSTFVVVRFRCLAVSRKLAGFGIILTMARRGNISGFNSVFDLYSLHICY